MGGIGEVAGGEVEGHGFQAAASQPFTKGYLEAIEGFGAAAKGRVHLVVGERGRAGQRFVQAHPGVNQQPVVGALFGGQPEVEIEDGVGELPAMSFGIAAIQPGHLLLQLDEDAADDERVRRKLAADVAQQTPIAGVDQNGRRFGLAQGLAQELHGAVLDVEP